MTEQKSGQDQAPKRESFLQEYYRLKKELDEVLLYMGPGHEDFKLASDLRLRILTHDENLNDKQRYELGKKQLERLISCILAIAPVALFILASVTEAESIAVAARISLVVSALMVMSRSMRIDLYFEQMHDQDRQFKYVEGMLVLTVQLKEFLSRYEVADRDTAPHLVTIAPRV